MKIALLTGTFSAFSGIDRVVQYQAEVLLAQGHQITIIALAGDLAPVPGAQLVVLGLPTNPLLERVYRLFYVWFPWIVWRHASRLQGFDRLIAHQYPMTAMAAAAKRRFGMEYWYHDHGLPPAEIFSSVTERWYIRLFSLIMSPTIRQADRVICISRYLQAEMQRRYGIMAEVQPDRVDRKRFHPGVNRERVRQKHNLGIRPVAVFVGRIAPHKNIETLIRAFRLVDATLDGALVIVGKRTFGRYGRSLDSLATPNVIFAGYVTDDEIPNYYGAADVYATATLWEGYDLPVAEAHACGIPAVMFNIGPHPEIAQSEDRLVPPNDVIAFANALTEVLHEQGFPKTYPSNPID